MPTSMPSPLEQQHPSRLSTAVMMPKIIPACAIPRSLGLASPDSIEIKAFLPNTHATTPKLRGRGMQKGKKHPVRSDTNPTMPSTSERTASVPNFPLAKDYTRSATGISINFSKHHLYAWTH